MQQGSFREFRLENERKVKKLNKQTTFLINKQGLRSFKKETIHHGAITKGFSSVIIILFPLLLSHSMRLGLLWHNFKYF